MSRFRLLARCATVLVAAATLAAVGFTEQYPAPEVRLHQGMVWLASNRIGHLTLLDGSSEEIAANVKVAKPDTKLVAVQQGSTGYAVDRREGTVTRVDGATLTAAASATPLPGAENALTVVPTPDAIYALNGSKGVLTRTDPRTLAPTGQLQSLPQHVDNTAVHDNALWVLDTSTGAPTHYHDGTRKVSDHKGTPHIAKLTNGPVLVDQNRRVAELLDPDTGAPQRTVPIDAGPENEVSIAGSRDRVLLSVGARGLVLSCGFADGQCTPVEVDPSDLGPAVEAQGHAFVPDYGLGRVLIIDLTTGTKIESGIFTGPRQFELISRDGFVFYNDPESAEAGVIGIDGRVQPIPKYDPTKPGTDNPLVPDEQKEQPQQEQPSLLPVPNPNDPRRQNDPRVPPSTGTPNSGIAAGAVSIEVRPGPRIGVGQEAEFTVRVRDNTVASARWTFGDTTTGTGTTVKHQWDRAGTYPVSVSAATVSGRLAPVATVTMTVSSTSGATLRISSISVVPEIPLTGQPVDFSANVAGQPERWAWTVSGPGGTENSTEQRFQRTFTAPGPYVATLRVFSGGVMAEEQQTFTVALPQTGVQCGDTITQSVLLTGNLICGSGTGLTIGGNDVVLDLGGFTISAQTAVIANGVSGAVIRNGNTVGTTDAAMLLNNTDGAQITSIGMNSGLQADAARNTQLSGVTMDGLQTDAVVRNGSSLLMSGGSVQLRDFFCTVNTTCTFDQVSVDTIRLTCDLDIASALTITGGVVDVGDVQCRSVTMRNLVQGTMNTISAQTATITDSTITQTPGNGLLLAAAAVSILRNNFSGGWHGLQIRDEPPFSGGFLQSGSISGNTFSNHGGVGLFINTLNHRPGNVLIDNNTMTSNGHDTDSQVHDKGGNRVRDGMRLYMPFGSDITLTNNRANNNSEFGIWVGPVPNAVIDQGTNQESGNPRGCQGITCG